MAMTEQEVKQVLDELWTLHTQQLGIIDQMVEKVENALGQNMRRIPSLVEAERCANRGLRELHHTAKVLVRGRLDKNNGGGCCSCAMPLLLNTSDSCGCCEGSVPPSNSCGCCNCGNSGDGD